MYRKGFSTYARDEPFPKRVRPKFCIISMCCMTSRKLRLEAVKKSELKNDVSPDALSLRLSVYVLTWTGLECLNL